MKKELYPETLYVAYDYQGKEKYLIADRSYKDFARTDETLEVAVYKLVRVAKAKNTTVLK